MRLELDIVNIKAIQFADKTMISDGVLSVDRQELQKFLQEDRRLGQVDIEVAHPGEKCRILQVSDVIEPRAKTRGSGENFPGSLGKQGIAGEGGTCVLRGAAVVMNDYSEGSAPFSDPNGEIIDMWGRAAEIGVYGKTHNVVVLPSPANNVSQDDYRIALKVAGLKTAVYLANAGTDVKPDEVEVYELPALAEVARGLEDLPKVAYIFSVLSAQFRSAIPGEPVLYGGNVEGTMPAILHPNEVFDGAVIAPYGGCGMDTYAIQNHAMIKELYRRHGKELCFAGVIITIAHTNELDSDRAASTAAKLAKEVLAVDGVILTKARGGFPEVDMARTAHRCEEQGLRTVLSMWQWPADVSALSSAGVIFNFPGVDAIVSMGTPWATITLPPVERVIGRPVPLPNGLPVSGEMDRGLRWIKGALSHLGNSRLTAVRY